MELLESGRELGRLRDFFSNPANFERASAAAAARNPATIGGGSSPSSPPRLARAASVQTFDSIDFARYSDDGERAESDRVAVLEFELRNAQDTIRLLRTALTKSAATVEVAPESAAASTGAAPTIGEPAQPYERRAVNFLVHEYLLRADYKLTSVTFSEENAGQDFDDWDDVGINVARPPDLLRIYREFGHCRSPAGAPLCDAGTATDDDLAMAAPAVDDLRRTLETRIARLNEQIRSLESDNARLVDQLERSGDRRRPVGSTPAVSPIKSTDRGAEIGGEISSASAVPDASATDDRRSTSDVLQDSEVSAGRADGPSEEYYETAVEEEASRSKHPAGDDGTDLPAAESAVSSPSTVRPDSLDGGVGSPTCRRTTAAFRQLLLASVFHVPPPDNRIFDELSRIASLGGGDDAVGRMTVPLLARCLPHVVPGVLLAARDELIPLIVAAAALHDDAAARDRLLNVLFNLIRRPDVDQRQMILLGCTAFARHAGAARVETELLPQCWEQLAHRHVERRLLVAEACGALAPHVPPSLRGSLLLSMLQQMLDDSVEDVREAAARSLGVVVGFVEDDDKYPATESLLFRRLLVDPSQRVRDAVRHVFLPSLAVWALDVGRLESSLLSTFVDRVENVVDPAGSGGAAAGSSAAAGVRLSEPEHFALLMNALSDLLPVVFASFLLSGPFAAADASDAAGGRGSGSSARSLPKPGVELLSASLVVGDEARLDDLLRRHDRYVDAEWYHPWPTHDWVSGELVARLVTVCEQLDPGDQATVHVLAAFFGRLCRTFGRTFARGVVRRRFGARLQLPAAGVAELSHMERATLVGGAAPVYAAGVLAADDDDDDRAALARFVADLVRAAALHRCGLGAVSAAVTELCSPSVDDDGPSVPPDLLLSVLWDCVVDASPAVRAAAARLLEPTVRSGGVPEPLVGTRVVPALVTLAGDADADVRAACVAALGATVECVGDRAILDKVLFTLFILSLDACHIGSRPSDHYFRSVCWFVCLFVQSFSQPSLIGFRSTN